MHDPVCCPDMGYSTPDGLIKLQTNEAGEPQPLKKRGDINFKETT